MAFTMHSHSGQFCSHAVDQLEDIVRHAISIGFTTMGLTEHMPRLEERDLYPEELSNPSASLSAMPSRHAAYMTESLRLKTLYAPSVSLLIAFEAEFIRPCYAPAVHALARHPAIDYFIGSVHHVHGIPIDYDAASYAAARVASGSKVALEDAGSGSEKVLHDASSYDASSYAAAGSEEALHTATSYSATHAASGSEEALYEAYYDLQFDMLRTLRPRVVGHFDLIRLLSETPDRDIRAWDGVWARVRRNLEEAARQGAWLECNTAALRKGLAEPYPCRPIAEEWLRLGGKFTMSDDSHGIAHLATNYSAGITYLESLGVTHVWTFEPSPYPPPPEKLPLKEVGVPLTEFRNLFP